MNNRSFRNGLLASVAVAALALYILACTSFSPDDTKVLYPAFDAKSRTVGISVYDRVSGATEQLFLPILAAGREESDPEPRLLRATWTADGQSIVVAWPGTHNIQEDGQLNVVLLPAEGRGTTKIYCLEGIEEALLQMSRPLALAGSHLFAVGISNRLVRLDLDTGKIKTHPCAGEIMLYPTPRGNQLLYVQEKDFKEETKLEFGRMNPNSFAQRAVLEFPDAIADGGFLAFAADGNSMASMDEDGDTLRLVIRRRGQADISRALEAQGEKLQFGNAAFSPGNDVLYATYVSVDEAKKKAAYGLMEIPVKDQAIRRTILIPEANSRQAESIFYFQLNLAHDGKTAAVATTYLAIDDEEFRPEDCALFLVDLSDPDRKVTKVPIPLPQKRQEPKK